MFIGGRQVCFRKLTTVLTLAPERYFWTSKKAYGRFYPRQH